MELSEMKPMHVEVREKLINSQDLFLGITLFFFEFSQTLAFFFISKINSIENAG